MHISRSAARSRRSDSREIRPSLAHRPWHTAQRSHVLGHPGPGRAWQGRSLEWYWMATLQRGESVGQQYRTPRTAPGRAYFEEAVCMSRSADQPPASGTWSPNVAETLLNGHISLGRADWFRAALWSSNKPPMSVASDLLPDFQRSPRRRVTVTLEPSLVPIACLRVTDDEDRLDTGPDDSPADERGPHPIFPP
jgi:hypothetical protein